MLRLTEHGEYRLRKRSGIPKRATERVAQQALQRGVKHAETTGRLRRYLDGLYLRERKADNVRLYHDCIYLFFGHTLITVIKVPPDLRKAALKANRRREDDLTHAETDDGIGDTEGSSRRDRARPLKVKRRWVLPDRGEDGADPIR